MWGMWSGPGPRRLVDGVGGAQPRRCEGGERSSVRTVSLARGWWRGHRAERWTVFELLQARHAPLLMIPGVWDIELERELTIARRASPWQQREEKGGTGRPARQRANVTYV